MAHMVKLVELFLVLLQQHTVCVVRCRISDYAMSVAEENV